MSHPARAEGLGKHAHFYIHANLDVYTVTSGYQTNLTFFCLCFLFGREWGRGIFTFRSPLMCFNIGNGPRIPIPKVYRYHLILHRFLVSSTRIKQSEPFENQVRTPKTDCNPAPPTTQLPSVSLSLSTPVRLQRPKCRIVTAKSLIHP